MTSATIGPRRRALLEAWAEHISTTASGTHYDLSDDNRTAQIQRHVDAFLSDPSEDSFETLWSYESLADSILGGPSQVLSQWDSVAELAACLETIRDATEYDPSWEEHFPAKTAVWELYGRLHPSSEPIVFSECLGGLEALGYGSISTFADARSTWAEFEEHYRSIAGHATEGTAHEVPLAHEMSEFLRFISAADSETLEDTLQPSDDYYPLVRWREEGTVEGDIQLTGHEEHLEGFIKAKKQDGFQKDGSDDLWNGPHWESWKDDYLAHMDTAIKPEYDLTDLDPDSVPSLLDDLHESTTLSTPVPSYMLGGRQGGILWSAFKERSLKDTAETADVLSYLFDEDEDIGVRLDRFIEWYGTIDTSDGQLLSLATILLTFVYPREYVFYKWSLMNSFFGDFADYDVNTGFHTSQYWKLNLACREQLLAVLDQEFDDATLLDVHSLLYVYHNRYAE